MRISIPLARPGFIGFVAIYAMLGNCVAAISPQELRQFFDGKLLQVYDVYRALLNEDVSQNNYAV